jgi:tRNA pseudouridine13 synthase
VAKVRPEDFEVEELPDFSPSGEGEHLYVFVEKRGRETLEVARALGQAGGVSLRDVGYAGLKDRQALTRQWFSLPAKTLAPITMEGVTVLSQTRHSQKLRTGVLRGNRFRVRVRGTTDLAGAKLLLDRLSLVGVPNWFGPQRFGRRSDNAVLGAALIGVGEHPSTQQVTHDPFLRKLALSALQSELFNRLLATRVVEGRLGELEAGDLLEAPEDPRPIVATDPTPWRSRVEAFEVAVTGPMFGARMTLPTGVPAEREAAVLEEAGIARVSFARGGQEMRGTRRAYRIRPEGLSATAEADALMLTFDLPAGSYATSILRELTRAPEMAVEEPA